MKLAFSWDDGALEDQKLFELHEKYEIPGMFFVPTRNREGRDVLTPEIIRNAESKYISFGGHTANHTYLTKIPINQVDEEVSSNQKYLQDILGHSVDDFCLPGGQYNQQILDIVYGRFKTIRTADTMNFLYRVGPLKPAIHFYPRGVKSLLGNAIRNKSYKEILCVCTNSKKDYFEIIKKLIDAENKNKNSVVMIWGHGWEIEELDLWDKIEDLFLYIKSNCNSNIVNYQSMFDCEKFYDNNNV